MRITIEFEIQTILEEQGHKITNSEPWETYWQHNMVWFLRDYGWGDAGLENIKSIKVEP